MTQPAGLGTPLSPREREILIRVALGLTDPEIGHALHISTNTVKSHVKRMLDKLGAVNRTNMVAIAGCVGMVGYREVPVRVAVVRRYDPAELLRLHTGHPVVGSEAGTRKGAAQ